MSEIETSSAASVTELREEMHSTEPSIEAAPAAPVSNEEVMVAQALSRIKKQSKQIEKMNKMLAKFPSQFKDAEKRQSKQFAQMGKQIKQLRAQVKQLQKQVARIKVPASKKKQRR